ncbi:oxidoreductase-like domain-containing protein [Abyssibacter sp.]|uniref:oxidoreductase-like domain-containing protein n=1 Tax=Abyssibacter sp. TaxID=2320200 RepID=UPI000C5615FD|nr:oxidoreductase-like domain-containing protein [Abyssibacter sp.]MBB87925.1 oxidoreductase-like protein [Xanthomonadales bacterium]MCK5857716.1 hypothetical protein [Abyssibacter sp.]
MLTRDRVTTDQPADPKPNPPEKPLPFDCCETGCDPCVWDMYADQQRAYERALTAWRQRNPAAG